MFAAYAPGRFPQVLLLPIQFTAGEIALYVRGSALARALFDRAVTLDPTSGRAHLGLASAAMMDGAFDEAAKRVWSAREHGVSERLRRALGGAITELQRIAVPDGTFKCQPGTPGC